MFKYVRSIGADVGLTKVTAMLLEEGHSRCSVPSCEVARGEARYDERPPCVLVRLNHRQHAGHSTLQSRCVYDERWQT